MLVLLLCCCTQPPKTQTLNLGIGGWPFGAPLVLGLVLLWLWLLWLLLVWTSLDPPPPDRPKFRSFFPFPATISIFLSLFGCLLVEFWWCLEAPEPFNVETNDGLPRKPRGGLGTERLGFEGTDREEFRKGDCGFSKNLLSVSPLLKTGHEVVFTSGKSYIWHLKTGARQPMVEKSGVFEVSYDLSPYAVGMKPSPRRDE